MTEDNRRSVEITRLRKARFVARNERGGELEFGEGDDAAFSPVELLLAAIAGCNAIDVDYITAKRAEAEQFVVTIEAEKIRDEQGNRMAGITLRFDVTFPDSEGGTAAREKLPSAVQRSHDRLCTVGRTVEVGTPITTHIAGADEV
jgi:putative redox protein